MCPKVVNGVNEKPEEQSQQAQCNRQKKNIYEDLMAVLDRVQQTPGDEQDNKHDKAKNHVKGDVINHRLPLRMILCGARLVLTPQIGGRFPFR